MQPAKRKADLKEWLWGGLLVAAVILIYQPAWHAGYIWDDDMYVTQNRLLTASDGLRRIWFSTDAPSQYFPFTYTVLRAEHAFWGLNAAGYHWVNIIMHAVNAVALWRLLERLKIPAAWLAAAIFAAHPVQVESVAWISEVKNLLSLFFMIAAVRAWVEFVDSRDPRSWRFYVLSLAAGAFALFSKTTACTLPAALVLVIWLKKWPLDLRRWLQVAPFAAMSVGMGLLTVWWEHAKQGTYGKTFEIGLLERCLVACHGVWFYLGKLVWPANLMFSYPRWNVDPASPGPWVWVLACLGGAAVIFALRNRFGRGPETAAVFFVAVLSPVLGFFMLYTFKYTFVADHYQYVASIGPFTLGAAALGRKWKGREDALRVARPVVGGLVLLVLCAMTWRECAIYSDSETLWRATLARNPGSIMAHNNLANDLLDRGRLDESIAQSEAALTLESSNATALCNLGGAFLLKGQLDSAISYSRKSIVAQPLAPRPYYNLGQAFLQRNQFDGAITNFQKAIELKPDYAQAYCNLGFALLRERRTAEAVANYDKALDLEPDYPLAHNDLGHILLESGRPGDAAVHFQRAVDVAPKFFEAHYNLAQAFVELGRLDDAGREFEAALAIHPNLPEAQYQLGNVARRQGRYAEAAGRYSAALQMRPNFLAACNSLAWLLATCPESAIRNADRAVQTALQAEKISGGRDATALATLGAAYAEAGKFPEAIAAVERAIEATGAQGNEALAAGFRAQLAGYRVGKAFRDDGRK
jgi:tetratricopeptide (TPR) repeat protein